MTKLMMDEAARLKETFSANLNRLMARNDKKISDISTDLNVAYSTVADWVHGRKYPRMDKVQALADYFNVLKSELTEEKPDQKIELSSAKRKILELIDSLDEDTVEMLYNVAMSILERRER